MVFRAVHEVGVDCRKTFLLQHAPGIYRHVFSFFYAVNSLVHEILSIIVVLLWYLHIEELQRQ